MTSNDWWRGGVVYQIYPRSYKDTNQDGIGDLKGITEQLPYIASLGVDAIWISPIMQSPMKDFGYDVSDYYAIDPIFGALDDFKTLLARAHDLQLKVIIDVIYSHTSDQHPWFQESRKSRDNPKSDWYVWANPRDDGGPPNNWISVFGGSSWQYDSWRGQYYLHNFLKEQPDLNYHNPAVQNAMLDMTRFWLDLGVDGLRLDAINFCFHDTALRDNPPRPVEKGAQATQLEFVDPYSMQWHRYDKSQSEMIGFLQKIRALLDLYPGTMALGEVGDDDEIGRAIEYSVGTDRLHTCYNFSLTGAKPSKPDQVRGAVQSFHVRAEGTGAWPSWAFSNHDLVRGVSRWAGDYQTHPVLAKTLIALLTSLRGTAFVYQGEELGLPETRVAWEDIQDPWGKYLYPKWQGRDGCRTPMSWMQTGAHLGFTEASANPWLPTNPDFGPLAVNVQEEDPHSTLNFVRAFLKMRCNNPALIQGDISFFETMIPGLLAFERRHGSERLLCVFNMTQESQRWDVSPEYQCQPVFDWSGVTGNIGDGEIVLPAFCFVIIK